MLALIERQNLSLATQVEKSAKGKSPSGFPSKGDGSEGQGERDCGGGEALAVRIRSPSSLSPSHLHDPHTRLFPPTIQAQ